MTITPETLARLRSLTEKVKWCRARGGSLTDLAKALREFEIACDPQTVISILDALDEWKRKAESYEALRRHDASMGDDFKHGY